MLIVKKKHNDPKINVYEINFALVLLYFFIINWIFYPIWFYVFFITMVFLFLPIWKILFAKDIVKQIDFWVIYKFYIWKKIWEPIDKYTRFSFERKKPVILIVTISEVVENKKNTEKVQTKEVVYWNITENTKINQFKQEIFWNIEKKTETPQAKKIVDWNIVEKLNKMTIVEKKKTKQIKKEVYWNIVENIKIKSWFFNVQKRSPLSFTWLFLSLFAAIYWNSIPFVIYILLVMISLIIVGVFFKNKKEKEVLQWKKPFNIEILIVNIAFFLSFSQIVFIIFRYGKRGRIHRRKI
jgi:hypothetical protein